MLQCRFKQIDKFRRHPLQVQSQTFSSLMSAGASTSFGVEHSVRGKMSQEEFARRVPLYDYDSFKPYVERMLAHEKSVASRGRIKMFARSSGTTSDRSKYIPLSERGLRNNHMRGMSDVSVIYNNMYPSSKILDGKVLTLGGTESIENGNMIGDLSGLLIRRFTLGNGWFRLPDVDTALLANFDEKCERICRECLSENVTSFAGVPSWNLALMSRVLEYSGKQTLNEVWPNIELFIHGGIEMSPYREAFRAIDGGAMRYMETYNASEGFFAIADDLSRDDMLLMLDYETYYEFRQADTVVPLEGVKVGETYALIITSSNGLWRYELGDMVEFTSVDPYRIRFAGRTRQYINAFGEEVIVDNSDKAIVEASRECGAVVCDYMVAPHFMNIGEQGYHQWLIEFVRKPADIKLFTKVLDDSLRRINSDYDAKRSSTLTLPDVRVVESGTFLRWMRENHKNKLPRLSNNRKMIEQVLLWIESKTI